MTTNAPRDNCLYWIEQLGSPNPIVRMQAAARLPCARGELLPAVTALIGALEDYSSGVRAIAAYSLGRIGRPTEAAIPSLLALLKDTNCHVNLFVRDALKRIAPELNIIGEQSIQGLSMESRLALESLFQTGSSSRANEILPDVFAALESVDPSDRFQALRAMKALGSEATPLLPTIEEFLYDENYMVRLSAVQAIGSIGFSSDVIRTRLKPMLDDSDRLVRLMAKDIINSGTAKADSVN